MKSIIVLFTVLFIGAQANESCVQNVLTNLNVGGMDCDNYDQLLNPGTALSNSQLDALCSPGSQCYAALNAVLELQCRFNESINPLLCARNGDRYCLRDRDNIRAVIAGTDLTKSCETGCADPAAQVSCEAAINAYGCCGSSELMLMTALDETTILSDCTNLNAQCTSGGPPDEIGGSACFRNNFANLALEVSAECLAGINKVSLPFNTITNEDLVGICDNENCAPKLQEFFIKNCDDPDTIRAVCSKGDDDRFCFLNLLAFADEVSQVGNETCESSNCVTNAACRNAVEQLTCCNGAAANFAVYLGESPPLPSDCSITKCAIPPGLEDDGAIPLRSFPAWLLVAVLVASFLLY